MKTVLYDGAEDGDLSTSRISDELLDRLHAAGCATACVRLRDMDVGWCRGCFGCWVQTPGICVQDDDGRQVAAAYVQSELAVIVTPVVFGGYGALAKRAVDRLVCHLGDGMRRYGALIRHDARYARMPRLLVIGVGVVDKEESELFHRMAAANGRGLHAPRTRAIVAPHIAALDALLPSALRELREAV